MRKVLETTIKVVKVLTEVIVDAIKNRKSSKTKANERTKICARD